MWKCRRFNHKYVNPHTSISLRPLTKRDIPAAIQAMNDPDARYMLNTRHAQLPDIATKLTHSIAATGQNPYRAEFAILHNHTVIGVRSLSQISPGTLLTGSWIHRQYRGQHIGSETLTAIRQLAHHHLGYNELLSATLPHNVPARRMLEANGMKVLSHAWPHIHDDGTYSQCIWYISHQTAQKCAHA